MVRTSPIKAAAIPVNRVVITGSKDEIRPFTQNFKVHTAGRKSGNRHCHVKDQIARTTKEIMVNPMVHITIKKTIGLIRARKEFRFPFVTKDLEKK